MAPSPSRSGSALRWSSRSPNVENKKYGDPHDVHEMPVVGGRFIPFNLIVLPSESSRYQAAEDEQHYQSDENVQTVKSRGREKGRGKEVRPWIDALRKESLEFEALAQNEERAQNERQLQPAPHATRIFSPQRLLGKPHRAAAGPKRHAVHAGRGRVQIAPGVGAAFRTAVIKDERSNQEREEYGVRSDEGGHENLALVREKVEGHRVTGPFSLWPSCSSAANLDPRGV